MNQEAIKKFIEIRGLLKRLSDEMCLVVESYYIWSTLTFAVSVPEVGQEKAERNVRILSRYNDFFTATKHSHFQTFVLGVNKFFDKSSGSLSLDRLIREISKYQYAFKPEVVRVALPELGQRGFVPDDYKPIDQATTQTIQKLKNEHKEILSILEGIRHEQVAHAAVQTVKRDIVPVRIEEFISAIQEMFNTLSGKFDLSSTHWGHLQDAAIYTTAYLLDDLELGEKKRMEERGKIIR
ncbi:MAG: hypothetical protein WA021_03080 [Minisyncoccia bacterium]